MHYTTLLVSRFDYFHSVLTKYSRHYLSCGERCKYFTIHNPHIRIKITIINNQYWGVLRSGKTPCTPHSTSTLMIFQTVKVSLKIEHYTHDKNCSYFQNGKWIYEIDINFFLRCVFVALSSKMSFPYGDFLPFNFLQIFYHSSLSLTRTNA